MSDISTSWAAPLAASTCRIQRPRLYALVSAGEFAAISRLPKFDRAAASADLCKSEIVVALEIEAKLRPVEAEILPQANG